MKLFRKRADQIEARLPATDRKLELLRCLTKRRADRRLLRVRRIAKLLGRLADEVHDMLATPQRKGLVARPSMESGTHFQIGSHYVGQEKWQPPKNQTVPTWRDSGKSIRGSGRIKISYRLAIAKSCSPCSP